MRLEDVRVWNSYLESGLVGDAAVEGSTLCVIGRGWRPTANSVKRLYSSSTSMCTHGGDGV